MRPQGEVERKPQGPQAFNEQGYWQGGQCRRRVEGSSPSMGGGMSFDLQGEGDKGLKEAVKPQASPAPSLGRLSSVSSASSSVN